MGRKIFLLAIGYAAASCGPPTSLVAPTKGRPTPAAASASASAATGSTLTLQLGKTRLVPLVSDSWQARDRLSLDKDDMLYVGGSGQRWLVREVPAPLPDDPDHTRYVLTGAPMMAPENLVAVRKKPDGSFLFVGESGATYRSKEALSDLIDARTPPEPLRAVTMGKDAIVGVTRRDTLLRSTDDGVSFKAVSIPKTSTIPVALVGNARGELAILSSPGKLLASVDDGVTFRFVATEGLGPNTLTRSAFDETIFLRGTTVSPTKPPGLAAISFTNALLARSGDNPIVERTKKGALGFARPTNDGEALGLADSVSTGHAVLHDLKYLEVSSEGGEKTGLAAYVLDQGKVTSAPIAGTNDCELTGVAGAAGSVAMMCLRSVTVAGTPRDELQYFRSTDFGKTFTREAMALPAVEGQRTLALSNKGTIFATGVCTAGPNCEDLLYKPTGAKAFAKATLPAGHVAWKVFPAGDGEKVYALATHKEDGTNALLVSKDGGKSFVARTAPPDRVDDAVHIAFDETTSTLALFATGDPLIRYATRDDGVTWDEKELPFAVDWVSLAGARGLATGGPGLGYETLDFGATFSLVPLPASNAVGGTMPIGCTPKGCLIGDVALREGWELKTAADNKPIAKPAAAAAKKLVHLPLVECTTEGEDVEVGTLSEPEVDPSSGIAWAALSDGPTGAIDVVSWPRGGKASARASMLPAPKDPVAVRRWLSADGAIVMRVPRGDGKAVVDVEVAWWVATTNKVLRATLPKASTSLGKWGTPSGLLAIAPGYGLYVRPGNSTEPVLFLVKDSGAVSKVTTNGPLPAWPRMFARRVTNGTLFAGPNSESITGDRAVVFANLSDAGAINTHAWGLWPRTATRAELAFNAEQLVLSSQGDANMVPHAWTLPWKDGALDPAEPTALASGKELADAPACASTSPRIRVPWSTGARTPYVIKGAKLPYAFATLSTTLRIGDKTCARGSLAAAPNGAVANEWLLFTADEPTRGFLLTKGNKTHTMRRVTCQKSSAPLPTSFSNAKGFTE